MATIQELTRLVDTLQNQLDDLSRQMTTLVREPITPPGAGGGLRRFAVVKAFFVGTNVVKVQPIVRDMGDVDDDSIAVTFVEDGDPEFVFVFPHMLSDDFEQFVSVEPLSADDPVIKLIESEGDWYAEQTIRFDIAKERTDLQKASC